MRVRVRYDMPDENGKSRRERTADFADDVLDQLGGPSPELEIPPDGEYLWDWFWAFCDRVRRVSDGVCGPFPPSEFLAWCTASGTIVYPAEYAILCAMDDVFCSEMNKEIKDFRTRQDEQRKAEMEAAKRKR